MSSTASRSYWRANRLLITVLLVIWGTVSYLFAILMARPLASVSVGRLPMSFWWAHQGSMLVFVVLIFVYAIAMDRLDRKYDVHEEDER